MKKRVRVSSLIPVYTATSIVLLLLAISGSRAATVLAENAPIKNRNCVVIDAGHGGVDGGATSCTGILESKVNLEIALRLEDLMHLLGIDTVMIRNTDRSIHTQGQTIAQKKVSDLKQRVKIVNETDNAFLVSIHQNHFADSRYYGAQVFYASTQGSEELAGTLQIKLVECLNPKSNRKSKSASGVYLMQNIDCIGLLVECGFLSNPEEEAKLRSADYQKKLCCVIASVFSEYLNPKMIT